MDLNIKGVLKGAAISLLITAILIFVLALLSYFTHIGENTVTICAYASVMVGIFIGSVLVSIGVQAKRLLHVIIMCTIYAVVLSSLSVVLNGSLTFNAHMAAVIGGMFAAALFGAIIGSRS